MTIANSDVLRPLLKARVAGACYLVIVLGGVFAQAAVFQRLHVSGDPAATINQIEANASLWRVGLAANLLYLLANIPLATILFGFFRARCPVMAMCALGFVAVTTAMEGINLALLYVPLLVSENAAALSSFGFQGQALSYLALCLHPISFGFALLFFAGFCTLTGALIMRSRLAPRVIGLMMVVAGGCYAVNTMLMLLAPEQWQLVSPQIIAPCLIAELSLAIWLLVRGARDVSEGEPATIRHAVPANA